MDHPNEDLVRKLYDARRRGDEDVVRSLLASDVRWHDPYPPPFGGDFTGGDEVVAWMFGPLEQEMDNSGLELHDVVANDRHAVALVNWWAVLGGRRMDGREVGVYHIQDGKLRRSGSRPRTGNCPTPSFPVAKQVEENSTPQES